MGIAKRWLVAGCLLLASSSVFAQDEIKIGILSFRSKPQTLSQWAPLATELNRAIPEYKFIVEAYGLNELSAAVNARQVDFILTNSGHYVLMAHRSGLSAPLATMINLEQGKPVSSFGGVIFTRADKTDINQLKDIRGKTVAVFSTDSLGGYQMEAYELIHAGMRIPQDIQLKKMGQSQDDIVTAVLSNNAEVGFVRSGLLESLVSEGKLDIAGIKILNRQDLPYFPDVVSTPLYPEWPFVSLPHISRELKRKVASFLLNIEANKALSQSLKIQGFDVPADYEPVVEVLRQLRMPPFDIAPEFTLSDVWNRYRWPIASSVAAFALILLLGFNLLLAIRRLKSEKALVQSQSMLLTSSNHRFEAVLHAVPDLMFEIDSTGRYLNVWGVRGDLLAAPENQLLGHTVEEMLPEDAAKEVLAAIAEADEKGASFGREISLQLPQGLCWFELSMSKRQSSLSKEVSFIVLSRDISHRKNAEKQIEQLAFYDPLTGLPNRRLLQDRLNQALSSSARSGHTNAVLFIDLDDFKTINDTLGHDIGDLLLQQVAHRIQSCLREGDTVARPGGDEFVVMLSDLHEHTLEAASQTEAVGQKILDTLNQPYLLSGHICHNTPSIGATLFGGQKQATEEIMKQADIAMYQAKKSGRNALRFFDPEMQLAISSFAALEGALRTALVNEELHLYYQLQVDNAGRPVGAEALIRWIHPERGLVSPGQFIQLAEDNGQIFAIGKWVLDTACAQLKEWQQDSSTRDLVLAVNVSAKQFRQPGFVPQVQSSVNHYAIDPRLLKLELTESMLVSNVEETIKIMNSLREIGVRFSLDDFGTGYSSLQYLKRLPLDQIKIDQSFVRDIATDPSDAAIVQTIIAMAETLGLEVIAEGVETEEQREFLDLRGCHAYQGYLFSKPISIDEFEILLKEKSWQ